MSCDRGFGLVEQEYKKAKNSRISCPAEYGRIISKLTDTGYKYLNAHDILDLKELTNENNCSFKHNIAKNCKFSKCRTILLSNTEPQSMTLFSYDKETRLEKVEVVPLADEKWPIATMETAEEFKLHYLTKNS